MAHDAPLLFTSRNPKRRLLVRTTIDNWQTAPLISRNPERLLVGPTIDNSQPQAIAPPPCPEKGYAAGVSRVSTPEVSNQLLGYRLPVRVRNTLAPVVVFAAARAPGDPPDVAVGLALAAHLAMKYPRVSLVVVPRYYLESDPQLEEQLRDQRGPVQGGVVLGSTRILSDDTQALLRQVLTSTDRQGVLSQLDADLGSVGPLVAALLALVGLGTVVRVAPEIIRQIVIVTGQATGSGSSATTGQATGSGSSATTGQATGSGSSATTGQATGSGSSATTGQATGSGSSATTGQATGSGSSATTGQATGSGSSATTGQATGSDYQHAPTRRPPPAN